MHCDLVAALARARTLEEPGPDTPAGPATPPWPGSGLPLLGGGPCPLDLSVLLRLALAAADPGGQLRPAPSAGGLHPVDAVLVAGPDGPLPAGRWGYDPLHHRVHRLTGPAGPAAAPYGLRVELTADVRRTASHYGHRSWPLALLDTGHAAAALRLAAAALGLPDPAVDLSGEREVPLATVEFGAPGRPPRPPGELAVTGDLLLSRRSTQPPLRGALPPEQLRTLLRLATEAGGPALRWYVARGGPTPDLAALDEHGQLRRTAAGDARTTLAGWAARQGWVADCGAVLLAAGCPDDADPPAIRTAHLHAGHAVHHAQLAATAAGLGARPLGAWQQADLGAALGGPRGREWVVHGLALGARPAADRAGAARTAAVRPQPRPSALRPDPPRSAVRPGPDHPPAHRTEPAP